MAKKLPEKGTPEWHRVQIAKKTAMMNPVMAESFGDMSVDEAKKIVSEYGIKFDRGGTVVGESHANGGVPFELSDTGTHIEEEGNEINIPRELGDSDKEYEFEGTNYEILNKILKLGNLSLKNEVTEVKSGDIVICIKSAWDDVQRKYKGTIRQILSAINESRGCNHIESGATMKNLETGEEKKMARGGRAKSQLDIGIEVEKEHRDLYLRLKKRLAKEGMRMPISETEFYTAIAKRHLKEDEDYYKLLLKYVEKKKMAGGGDVKNWFYRTDLDKYLYGSVESTKFGDERDESDEAYLELFPQDLLDVVENSMGMTDTSIARIEASNILKGLKEEGYEVAKRAAKNKKMAGGFADAEKIYVVYVEDKDYEGSTTIRGLVRDLDTFREWVEKTYGKDALKYEEKDSYGRGSLHFEYSVKKSEKYSEYYHIVAEPISFISPEDKKTGSSMAGGGAAKSNSGINWIITGTFI
jgi:hypothetical protein